MASYQVENAFRIAAEKALGRRISDLELKRIVEAYERSSGTTLDRAIHGIAQGANASEQAIRAKSASSDDVNRVMQDLRTVLDKR